MWKFASAEGSDREPGWEEDEGWEKRREEGEGKQGRLNRAQGFASYHDKKSDNGYRCQQNLHHPTMPPVIAWLPIPSVSCIVLTTCMQILALRDLRLSEHSL